MVGVAGMQASQSGMEIWGGLVRGISLVGD